MRGNQTLERRSRKERTISIHHQHESSVQSAHSVAAQHRVARASLLGLRLEPDSAPRDLRLNLFGLVADHGHHIFRLRNFQRRINHVL